MLVGLESKRLVTIEEVADRFGISKNHLMKVAYQLGQAGFLETVRDRNGGLGLGKAPSQIMVGEVVRKMEGTSSVAHLEENLKASAISLSDGEMREIEDATE